MNCFLLLTCTFLAGMAAGIFVTYLAMKAKAHYSGTLRVDRSDEDGPLLFSISMKIFRIFPCRKKLLFVWRIKTFFRKINSHCNGKL